MESWNLLFLLPNLHPPVPTPFDAGWIRICAGNDPALQHLAPNAGNVVAAQMMRSFRTQFGIPYDPACLIVDSGTPRSTLKTPTLRGFRNACAIATVLPGHDGRTWHPTFTDHFDLYPLAPGRHGGIVTTDAIVEGSHATAAGFQGQSSPLIQDPAHFTCQPSQGLLKGLLRAWDVAYLRKRRRPDLLRLFRSLEIAVHAGRFPTDSLLSLQEAGLRLGLWVSAFETLLHPGVQKVERASVLAFIRTLDWTARDLRRCCYRIRYGKVSSKTAKAEAICSDLYAARNDFLHGNIVPRRALYFRRDPKRALLSDLAPLVYWTTLEQRLGAILPQRGVHPPKNAGLRWLSTKAGRRFMHERAKTWVDRGNVEGALSEG